MPDDDREELAALYADAIALGLELERERPDRETALRLAVVIRQRIRGLRLVERDPQLAAMLLTLRALVHVVDVARAARN